MTISYLSDIQAQLNSNRELKLHIPAGCILEEESFQKNFDGDDAPEEPPYEFDDYYDTEEEDELMEEFERKIAA